ncbi:MAG: hypothetical protein HZB13_04510, partial [Acidobacteria bacterium]|nr:hypothetical protein [Acidobacteriota bacterium]
VRAESLTTCALYWLPVSAFPSRSQERDWLRAFLYALFEKLKADEIMPQCFMEYHHIHLHCHDLFIQRSLDLSPIFSFSRVPWAPMVAPPSKEEIDDLRNQRKVFELSNYTNGMCYWIPKFDPKPFLKEFLGFGGLTMLFPGPDPAAVSPSFKISPGVRNSPHFKEIFAMGDPQEELNKAMLLKHKFLGQTKKIFGRGWEERVEYRGLLFVLPRLASSDFFSLEPDVLAGLFDASPLYLIESAADHGVLLASKDPMDETIIPILESLHQQGLRYPSEGRA